MYLCPHLANDSGTCTITIIASSVLNLNNLFITRIYRMGGIMNSTQDHIEADVET